MLEPDCRYHMDAAGEMPYKAETEREREGLDRKVAWRLGEIVGRWGKVNWGDTTAGRMQGSRWMMGWGEAIREATLVLGAYFASQM